MSFWMVELAASAASDTTYVMPAAFMAVALAGLAAGYCYRASALILLSLATAISIVVIAASSEWTVLWTVLICFGLLTGLQLAYILGVALASQSEGIANAALRRVRSGGSHIRTRLRLGLPAEAGSPTRSDKRPES